MDRAGDVSRSYHEHGTYERITTDPDVRAGVPCLSGLRFPVATVVAMVADGMTTDEILAEHPDLTAEGIHESLLYAPRLSASCAAAHGVQFLIGNNLSPLLAEG